MTDPALRRANLVALLLPAALLGGALLSQYVGHLVPCEMCVWQRWPHLAAILLAIAALALPGGRRPLVLLAALAIAVSGAIGVFHAGVEYHWWKGLTRCTSLAVHAPGHDVLADILAAPIVRCDVPQWTLFGISLAGWNALISPAGSGVVAWLCLKPAR